MIKLISLAALGLGFILHFIEWLYDFKLNGWSFATVISVALLIERTHHNHQTRVMLKIIGEKVGVSWASSLQRNGLKVPRLFFKKHYSFLQMVTKHQKRRMSMLTNLFKTSLSKKLIALFLGAAVAILNKKLGLDLTPDELLTFLIVVGGYILGQSHIDARKVTAGIKDSPLLQMGFTEAIPILSEIHAGINDILADVKKNDGSQAFKDAMQAYAQIKPILDALKHPNPVSVVEDKVSA